MQYLFLKKETYVVACFITGKIYMIKIVMINPL